MTYVHPLPCTNKPIELRLSFPHPLLVRGGHVESTDKTPGWWQELHDEDLSDHTSRAARRFCGDFRVPYCFFEELVALVKQRDWFPTAKKDTVGRACIPVELKMSKINDGEKWPKLCYVDDIVSTAIIVVAASSVPYSVALVLFQTKMIRIMFTAVVFAEFYLLRSTRTTPVIVHPCYYLKCGIGVASNEDDSHNLQK